MPQDLIIALSPYHLATREVPAMLALILGSRIITLMPQPVRGQSREAVKTTVEHAPRYLRLMESWRWSAPLWQSGVISSDENGERPADELPSVYADIDADESLAALRPLTRAATQRAAESADKSLDFLAADVLKGGPDPGINIPISAALDRFAARHDLCVARAGGGGGAGSSGGGSLAQRAESRLGDRIFSFAMPILLRAGGGRIERLRDDLAGPLDALRHTIAAAADLALSRGYPLGEAIRDAGSESPKVRVRQPRDFGTPDLSPRRSGFPGTERRGSVVASPTLELLRAQCEAITASAAAYTKAFNAWSAAGGSSGDDENAERVVPGYVSVTGATIPVDAVLRAGRAAMSALHPSRADPAPMPEAPGRLFTLTIREMTVKPE